MRSGLYRTALLSLLLLVNAIPAHAVDEKRSGAVRPPASQFNTLAATASVTVTRDNLILPANKVPFLVKGDTVTITFPKAMQFSRAPRWHLIVAKMYDDYVARAPVFLIADADLSRARPGASWTIPVDGNGTPIFFLVPENGNRAGRGMTEARDAIQTLENREALMKSALFSESAKAKASTLDDFMKSLATIDGGDYTDGRARVTAAAQSLFGYDLGQASCFTPNLPQSDQYACAAQAVATNYQRPTAVSVTSALGSQLSVETATYGMLIGAIYELLAKHRVDANYTFAPGALNPDASNTDVYAQERMQYDPAASKPSSVVYFQIGSEPIGADDPSFGGIPNLPVCMSDGTFNVIVPFSGLPVYFRAHNVMFNGGGSAFAVPAEYNSVSGYSAQLTPKQLQQIGGAHATVQSTWGFDTFASAPIALVRAHPVTWTLASSSATLVQGQKAAQLTFNEPDDGIGSCVSSVTVSDGLGHPLPVTDMQRSQDGVTITVDASHAQGSVGAAVVNQDGNIESKTIALPMLPALPAITAATAFLPKGELVLKGTNLKYIDKITLENTNIVFGNGKPNAQDDSQWVFTALTPTSFKPVWVHETMAISYTLLSPDTRKDAVEANVEYAASPTPPPSPIPSPSVAPTPSVAPSPTTTPTSAT